MRRALEPGGRFVCVVWRRKLDNPWMYAAEQVVKPLVDEPEETDEPRCGPGPFSQANADTLSGQLLSAGFTDIELRRSDRPIRIGADVDEAVAFNLALGPAAEAVRLAGENAASARPQIEELLRGALAAVRDADRSPGGLVDVDRHRPRARGLKTATPAWSARAGLRRAGSIPEIGVLELAHPGAERAPDLGQPLRAEEQQRHDEEQHDLERPDVTHDGEASTLRLDLRPAARIFFKP